ncbi:MAG: methyltransferase domain-containing protein [Pyrinomonadaceae bacterium]
MSQPEAKNNRPPETHGKKILDVGCGRNKHPGAVGMDINPATDADVIHDLGIVPYPFPDDEFDEVVSNHVIEHVPDPMMFVAELYRITKSGGRIKLLTPHYTNPDWPNDLTHRNHLNSYSFQNFIPERQLFAFYTTAKLKPVRLYVSLLNLWRALGLEFIVNLDQRWPALRFTRKFWEQYLSGIFRGKELQFEFEIIKTSTINKVEAARK